MYILYIYILYIYIYIIYTLYIYIYIIYILYIYIYIYILYIYYIYIRYRSDATLHTLAGACIKTRVDWLSARVYHYITLVEHV